MIDVLVSNNDRDRYPAVVDPDERHDEGYVKPYFDLETVRRIAAKTQADAAEFGHASIDTVHVFDGGAEDGEPRVLVVVVTWMDMEANGVDQATQIVVAHPGTGRYAIGGFPWCWYALDDELNPQIPFRAE